MIDTFSLLNIDDLFLGKKRPRRLLGKMQDIEKSLTLFLAMLSSKKFEWDGLPDELKYRKYLIEYILYYYGSAVLFKKDGTYYFLPAYLSSSLNVYGEPTIVYAYGLNGQSFGQVYIRDTYTLDANGKPKLEHKQDAVLFRNNAQNVPQYFFNKPYMSRLCYLWQTLGVQEGLSRIKLLIYANTDIAPKIKEIIDGIVDNADISCVVPSEMSSSLIDDVKDSNFGGEYVPQDAWYDFDKTFNLLLTFNGIKNNIETNKKERQTRAEVTSGQDLTMYSEEIRSEVRQIACDETKRIFGLDISFKDKVQEDIKQEELERAKAFTGGAGEEGKGDDNDDKSEPNKLDMGSKK